VKRERGGVEREENIWGLGWLSLSNAFSLSLNSPIREREREAPYREAVLATEESSRDVRSRGKQKKIEIEIEIEIQTEKSEKLN